jgi:hypothetical protein
MTPRKKRTAFTFLMLCGITLISAQDSKVKAINTKHFEIMAVPALAYNSLALGLSCRQNGVEHTFNLTGSFIWTGYSNLGSAILRYNRNYELYSGNKLSTYLPIWVSARYTSYSGNWESDTTPFELINFGLGGGYGTTIKLWCDHRLRIEFNAGVALSGFVRELDYYADEQFKLVEKNPVLPAGRLTIRYLIPLN